MRAPVKRGYWLVNDPCELRVRNRGRLPHWERNHATYFITFRLADSLPRSVLEKIGSECSSLIQTANQLGRELSEHERVRLSILRAKLIQQHLDRGAGECWLARPQVATCVAETLKIFNGDRYVLLAWCVMPNHVHVVARFLPGSGLAKVVHSWKSFTAKRANQLLGRSGSFWQREYFDHLVRNGRELDRIIAYVASNPGMAGLTRWKFVEVLTWAALARF